MVHSVGLSGMKRTHCANCEISLIEFLDLGESPLADILPQTPTEKLARYPLGLAVCPHCWLVQLTYVVPDAELYNADYAYYTGVSKGDYHRALAAQLQAEFAPKFVVEIGSNDGDLLQHFTDSRVLGIDPSAGPAEVAESREKPVPTLVASFGLAIADTVRSSSEMPDLIIANHVVAHVADLHDFFAGLERLLGPTGVISLEVQYVADLLTGNQFDNVYHQHRFFFSVSSLDAVARQHGLQVIREHKVDVQGGSIHAILARQQALYSKQSARVNEGGLQNLQAYVGMQTRVDYIRDKLLALLAEEKRRSHLVVGYGAPAKATTLFNYCGIDKHLVGAMEDTTPYKIGRYFPGTQIPIVKAGSEPAHTYLATVWNYLPKILRREAMFLESGGHIISPIPLPVLL